MDLGLRGKVIVISGGASGIGAAISRACLAEGAHVAIISRVTPAVEQFFSDPELPEDSCKLFECELTDTDRCRRVIELIESHFGGIDALVNNAGVNDGVGLDAGDVSRFRQSLESNLVQCYALTHFALPALKRSCGSVVNVSSKVALTGQGGTSGYAAAKGGMLALTREWAVELLPAKVRVNAVVPAEVMTPAYEQWLRTLGNPEQKLTEITAKIPLGHRMTTPEEIAAATVFLLSPLQSAHTTGQHIHADGGYVHLDRALT